MRNLCFILISFSFTAWAGNDFVKVKKQPHLPPSIEFIENQGQWPGNILYKSNLPGGELYIENGHLVYVFYSQDDVAKVHDIRHGTAEPSGSGDMKVRGHRFDFEFVDANTTTSYSGIKKRSNYYNFFIGNDQGKWKGKVPAFQQTYASNMWDGIDYRIYSQDVDLKYDFIVHPGSDPNQVRIRAKYLENIRLKHGNLYLTTSVNEMIDMKPIAYQKKGGKYQYIPCDFVLQGDEISFKFPEGYDPTIELVIDPKLIFSSYTGSTQDNWGITATYDAAGNLYAGGMVRNTGSYPTTTGAFQTNYNGGWEMGISKFNSNGTALLYSTYLGGSKVDLPHSLVVAPGGQLVVMGTTSSTDYPVSTNAYDNSFGFTGVGNRSLMQNSVVFNGSDIVVTKFNSGGTALIGSTYMGGNSYDGINSNVLRFNYGDEFRGEVVVDGSGNCYVASTTESNNFPVTNGSTHGGGTQDAVIFMLDSLLSNLTWSTYLGGIADDAAYSIQVNGSGLAIVGGGTASGNFPTTSGVINPAPLGGIDGFVTLINTVGGIVLSSTRLGTSAYDQTYFIQLDDSGYVYAAGQTEGNYPVQPSTVYSNSFSGQFVHKMNVSLTQTVFSTVFGTGGTSSNVDIDISLSAFLVNQCGHIYVAGWGGNINANLSNATSSTTNGLPVTAGAHKPTTDGNDFYLIVLDEDADSLLYATFFGGNNANSGEHNDGGTSRFDKRGIVYQAVCAGCGGNNTFPTSPPNVWSTTNNSSNCNMGVIKFDLAQFKANIGLDSVTKVCIPGSVKFNNTSDGGNSYFWDFGDGDTSNQFEPTHIYSDTGIFTVMLVVHDSLSCFETDTTYITVNGEAPPEAHIDSVPVICPGDSIMLQAYGGLKYEWFPKTQISNDTVSNPTVYPPTTTTYQVVVSDSCGSDTSNLIAYDSAIVDVVVATDNSSASPDDTLCAGDSKQLFASGGVSYFWKPATYLSKNNVSSPITTPLGSVTYTIRITDVHGCDWLQEINIRLEDSANPEIGVHPDTVICLGDTINLYAYGGKQYLWSPAEFISDSSLREPTVYPSTPTEFVVSIQSKCFQLYDTVFVDVDDFITMAMPDTFACEGIPLELWASPGEKFEWSPAEYLDNANAERPLATITEPTVFSVLAESKSGCTSRDSVEIDLRDMPYVSAGLDQYIQGVATRLAANGKGKVKWEPADLVDCPTCKEVEAIIPLESVLFIVTLTDEFGCTSTDHVLVSRVKDDLYIPNTFTPNSDLKNEVWKPIGYNIQEYELTIFNRWGEMIFHSKRLDFGWDGTYKGKTVENGVYVWNISYVQNGEVIEKFGTLTLLR